MPHLMAWIYQAGTAACRMQLFPDALSVRLEAMPDPHPPYRLIPLPHPLGDVRENPRALHKGILGDWDVQVRNQAYENHAEDALLLWPDGTLAETAIASIGLQACGDFFLPPLEGRVGSLTEALELPLWASDHGFALRRRPIALAEVSGGQLWCMNALRGLWQAEVVQL